VRDPCVYESYWVSHAHLLGITIYS